MTRPPAITVAVPTLRRPAMLAETLGSLLAQDFDDFELLVSDNGSGDETPAVVERLQCPRIRFRSNPATVPMVEHWNQLVAEARGELFVIVSDDDLVGPAFVGGMVRCLAQDRGVTLGLCRSEIIDRNGRTIRALPAHRWTIRPGPEFLLDWLCRGVTVSMPSLVSICTRTALLREIGGFPGFEGGLHADNACAVTLALLGLVGFSGDALLRYRVFPEQSGLSAPWQRLAEASRQARAHFASHPATVRGLAALDGRVRSRIDRGFLAYLGRTYKKRLLSHYLPSLGVREVLRAGFAYDRDPVYSRTLPWFVARTFFRRIRRLLRRALLDSRPARG